MNTRTALRKSLLIQPAVDALNRAENQAELEDAWFDFGDGFAEHSAERRELQAVYAARLRRIKEAEKLLNILRAG
jgi:hypothetical protein